MRIFHEVLSSYTDEETSETAIDGYFNSDPNSGGVIVAWVKPDGTWRLGENSKPEYLLCECVQENLHQVILANLKQTQESHPATPQPLSPVQYKHYVATALSKLEKAHRELAILWEMDSQFDCDLNESLQEKYPFNQSFDHLTEDIRVWREHSTTKLY